MILRVQMLTMVSAFVVIRSLNGVFGALVPREAPNYDLFVASTSSSIPYDQCGVSTHCFALDTDGGNEQGCISNQTCAALVTYDFDKTTELINFVLYRSVSNTSSPLYAALGFSHDGKMPHSVMIACLSGVDLSDLFQTLYANVTAKPASFDISSVTSHSSSINGNVSVCYFTMNTTSAIVSPDNETFDLAKPIHVLLAVGPVDGNDEIKYHSVKNGSVKAIALTDNSLTTTTASTTTTSTTPAPPNGIPYDRCNKDLGCFGLESDCVDHKSCHAVVTYAKSISNAREIDFDLYLTSASDEHYVAVGFNNAQQMDQANIVECIAHSSNFAMQAAVPDGYTTPKIVDTKGSLQPGKMGIDHNLLKCSFTITGGTIDPSSKINLIEQVYVLLAHGNVDKDGVILQHDEKVFSPDKIDLNQFSPSNGSTTSVSPNSSTTTTAASTTSTTPATPTGGIPYEKCGKTAGCFVLPRSGGSSECAGTKDCQAVAFYGVRAAPKLRRGLIGDAKNTSSGTIVFDLYLANAASERYVTLGLNNAGQMPKAFMVECVAHNSNVSLITAYAPERVPPKKADVGSAVKSTGAKLNDGVLHCSFEVSGIVNGSALAGEKYDMSQPLFLLLAVGDVNADGSIKKHATPDRIVSNEKLDLTKFAIAGGGGGATILVKLHACFMLAAWLFCATIGIASSQFYKTMWPNIKPLNKLLWFQIHRTLMMAAVVLSAAAFIMIFVHVGGWSKSASNIHPYIGTICFALALLQPCIAYFRPHPGEAKRVYFNYFHGTVGHVTHLLSVVAVILATFLDSIQISEGAHIAMWVFVGYLAVFYTLQIVILFTSTQAASLQQPTLPYVRVKNFLFALHETAALAFTATMFVSVIIM